MSPSDRIEPWSAMKIKIALIAWTITPINTLYVHFGSSCLDNIGEAKICLHFFAVEFLIFSHQLLAMIVPRRLVAISRTEYGISKVRHLHAFSDNVLQEIQGNGKVLESFLQVLTSSRIYFII